MRADPSLRQMTLFAHAWLEWEQVPADVRAQVLELISRLLQQSLEPELPTRLKETPHV